MAFKIQFKSEDPNKRFRVLFSDHFSFFIFRWISELFSFHGICHMEMAQRICSKSHFAFLRWPRNEFSVLIQVIQKTSSFVFFVFSLSLLFKEYWNVNRNEIENDFKRNSEGFFLLEKWPKAWPKTGHFYASFLPLKSFRCTQCYLLTWSCSLMVCINLASSVHSGWYG